MWDSLPDKALEENILLRLPVKSILQCRCVCKSWYSLITTRNFISTHLRNNNNVIKTEKTAIFFRDYQYDLARLLFLFDNQDYFRPFSLRVPDHNEWSQLVGSVNGLICFSIGHNFVGHIIKFMLFNPSIGHILSIPPPVHDLPDVRALGFDETTQDYKILYMVSKKCCFVYSLNSNSWKRLIAPDFYKSSEHSTVFDSIVYLNGGIYWLSCSNSMMVFDVKCETFCQISLPQCLANSRHMMEFGESSLAIFEKKQDVTHIWVTKEYGSVESWVKLATVDSQQGSKLLGLRNKEEVLIIYHKTKIVAQNIHNKLEVKNLPKVEGYMDITPFKVYKYVPSLALLDKQNNVDATFKVDVPHIAPSCQVKEELAPSHQVKALKEEGGLRRSKRGRKSFGRYQ